MSRTLSSPTDAPHHQTDTALGEEEVQTRTPRETFLPHPPRLLFPPPGAALPELAPGASSCASDGRCATQRECSFRGQRDEGIAAPKRERGQVPMPDLFHWISSSKCFLEAPLSRSYSRKATHKDIILNASEARELPSQAGTRGRAQSRWAAAWWCLSA